MSEEEKKCSVLAVIFKLYNVEANMNLRYILLSRALVNRLVRAFPLSGPPSNRQTKKSFPSRWAPDAAFCTPNTISLPLTLSFERARVGWKSSKCAPQLIYSIDERAWRRVFFRSKIFNHGHFRISTAHQWKAYIVASCNGKGIKNGRRNAEKKFLLN